MKFEFVQETDQLLSDTIYYTKQDGVYITGTLSTKKDVAYEIFMKVSQGMPIKITEVLETKTYQKPLQEE